MVYVDSSSNVYLNDQNSYRIRKISVDGIVAVFIGTGSNGTPQDGFVPTSTPIAGASFGMWIDTSSNVYFSDSYDNKVKTIPISSGLVYTIAGTNIFGIAGNYGPATSATLWTPGGIYGSSSSTMYICDQSNYMVRSLVVSRPPTPSPTTAAPSVGPTARPTFTPVVAPTFYSINAFAGISSCGDTGDGGPASWTSRRLPNPRRQRPT